jgi:hypothetical protein
LLGENVARNYAQSAIRHFQDAESLAASGRYDDAGHLIGLAAECALKHGARGFTRPANSEIDGHLPPVKWHIRQILDGRNARGALLSFVTNHQHFTDWHVNDRYQDDGHVNQEKYERWRNSAKLAMTVANLRISTA